MFNFFTLCLSTYCLGSSILDSLKNSIHVEITLVGWSRTNTYRFICQTSMKLGEKKRNSSLLLVLIFKTNVQCKYGIKEPLIVLFCYAFQDENNSLSLNNTSILITKSYIIGEKTMYIMNLKQKL